MPYLADLVSSTEREKETIFSLKIDYETVLEYLKEAKVFSENQANCFLMIISKIFFC